MTAPCPRCNGEGVTERQATPQEVDEGCELGVAFDPCDCTLGVCPACGDIMTLTQSRVMRVHGRPGRRCRGSGEAPRYTVAGRPINRSPYALQKREDKSNKLARLMHQFDATTRAARALDAAGRRIIEDAAGVPESSDETWRLAIAKLGRMNGD